MEGFIVFFHVFASVMAIIPGIKIASFVQSWPPVIYDDRDLYTVANIDAECAVTCAGHCLRTAGCLSFLYKQTDTPHENCFNTTTPQMYSGRINTALGGAPCHAWTSNHHWRNDTSDDSFPDGSMNAAENYCRDPLPDGYLWCPLEEGGPTQGVGWDTCNIPRCMSTNCRLFSLRFKLSPKMKLSDDIVFFYRPGPPGPPGPGAV